MFSPSDVYDCAAEPGERMSQTCEFAIGQRKKKKSEKKTAHKGHNRPIKSLVVLGINPNVMASVSTFTMATDLSRKVSQIVTNNERAQDHRVIGVLPINNQNQKSVVPFGRRSP